MMPRNKTEELLGVDKASIRKEMEDVATEYEAVREEFRTKFRGTLFAVGWEHPTNAILHEGNRALSNVKYALDKDEIPTVGGYSRSWEDHHIVHRISGIMRLILWLVSLAPEEVQYEALSQDTNHLQA